MNSLPLDHVGVAVASLDEALPLWEAITGARGSDRETVTSQGVELLFVGTGPGRVELLAPLGPESPLARFIERRGPGLHHICYRVPDIREALSAFIAAGFEPVDPEPRRGAHNHLIAFLHPRTSGGVLIELLEAGS